ncbi:MAG: hypothetical protein H0V26_14605 [Solirubrobacterales bacterium]|nr:hypothetical protein [Solirubrobacterales bacterium]
MAPVAPEAPGVLFTPATASNLRPAPRRVGHHGLRLAGELLPGDARGRHTRDGEQFGVSAAVASNAVLVSGVNLNAPPR